MSKIGVVLLNWNSAEDTIECIESIKKIKSYLVDIVVVDNNSKQDDLKQINKYIVKENGIVINENDSDSFNKSCNLLLIKNHKNYGFAGGCNIALRLLYKLEYQYYWLLNNDAIVDENTLIELVSTLKTNTKLGFVGSVIRYYDNKDKIECYGGGHHYPILGTSKLYMKNISVKIISKDPENYELDYLMGASLLTKKELIDDIGFMDSEYFLYFEEHDWQYRAKQQGWEIVVATLSNIYHKSSKSTKNNREKYFYYISRASMMFNKRHFSKIILLLSSFSLSLLLLYKTKLNFKNYSNGLRGIYHGLLFDWQGKK